METKMLERQQRILQHLSTLPRMMTHIHGRDNLSEFILHELCSEPCFNLRKAAYFVDNEDFNCLRGVAGFADDQAYPKKEMIWQYPDEFTHHMQRSSFNNKVRSINYESLKNQTSKQKFLDEAAQKLGFGTCDNCSWNMRHDNHGILMYEKVDPKDSIMENHIIDGLSLLSFCPIF